MPLFRWFIVRRLGHEPLRTVSTIVGIALGIAVIIAIQLANASSLRGFETALDATSGRTSLEILGTGAGFDERIVPSLLWIHGFGEISPVVQGDAVARLPGSPPELLRVLGVDILRDRPFREYRLLQWTRGDRQPTGQEFLQILLDRRAAVITSKYARAHGLSIGSTLPVGVGDRVEPLVVRGLLKDEGPARVLDGNFVLMDIAAAQDTLDRLGRLDRIDVRVPAGGDVDRAEAAIAAKLPPGLTVQRPEQRGRQVQQMLRAFHLNLTALSYIALLVGLFLIYNTVSVTVLARREEIGTLRALGVTRGGIRALFLAEAALLGIAGCALGLVVGRLLAGVAVRLTATTVSALYIAEAAAIPSLDRTHALLAFAIGVPLSLLAALLPAAEGASVPPTVAMRGADRVEAARRPVSHGWWRPAGLIGLAAWLATLGPVNGLPLFGYASALASVFGAALLVPAVLTLAVRALATPTRRLLGVEGWLALGNLGAAVPRLSVSVAALAVSLSMMVAIAVMIGSFRDTVVYWIGQTLQADLILGPAAGVRAGSEQTLSPEVVATAERTPGVVAVDRFRTIEVPYGDTRIQVGGGDFAVVLAHGTLLFKAPADAREAMRGAIGSDAVLVSESFSLKQHVRPGDTIRLPTRTGVHPFRVAAVYYDYTSDRGVLAMDRATFERFYGAGPPRTLNLYLADRGAAERVRQALLSRIGSGHRVFIHTNTSLRREVLRIFDSTFAITYALEVVAIVIAILGISGTLLTLVLERARELTILRLVGTERRQVRRMIITEAAVLGAISQAVGLGVGLVLSLILIYVINVQSFGWTIQFHVPVAFLIQSSLLIVCATALAGLYPARRAAQLTAIQEE